MKVRARSRVFAASFSERDPGHQGAWVGGAWEFQGRQREAGAGAWLRHGEAPCVGPGPSGPAQDMCLPLALGALAG